MTSAVKEWLGAFLGVALTEDTAAEVSCTCGQVQVTVVTLTGERDYVGLPVAEIETLHRRGVAISDAAARARHALDRLGVPPVGC